MSGEITRRNALPPMSRRARQSLVAASEAALSEQAATRAISAVSEHALNEVLFLKQTQAALELECPDAAPYLAAIANAAALSVSHQVRRFGTEMAG